MKVIDFVKRVLQESKVDLTKFTELNLETDLSDEVVTSYSNNLLSRERIEADPEINKTMQGRAFKALNDGWDKDFNAFAEANLPKELADKIKAETFTRNKWEILRKNVVAVGNGDNEKLKTANSEIERLNGEVLSKSKLIDETKTTYEGKLLEFQKNYLLSQKLGTLQWADAYVDLKQDLQEKFNRTISEKSVILEVSNGQLIPKHKGENGTLLDLYEANKKVSLDDLIEKELGKFTKQSNGSPSPTTPQPKPIAGTPAPALTLAEMEREKIKEKFNQLKQQ